MQELQAIKYVFSPMNINERAQDWGNYYVEGIQKRIKCSAELFLEKPLPKGYTNKQWKAQLREESF